MSKLPAPRQPDLENVVHPPPSLLLYCLLSAITGAFVILGFHLSDGNWKTLCMNLGASMASAIVILVIVERKLRRTDIHIVKGLFFPRRNHQKEYNTLLVQSLDVRLRNIVELKHYKALLDEALKGYVLFGKAGGGKTTALQWIALKLASLQHTGTRSGKSPILLTLRNWRHEQPLIDALYAQVCSIHYVPKWRFIRGLRNGEWILLLDGADEIFLRNLPFPNELEELRKKHTISCVVTSRTSHPISIEGLTEITLGDPTAAEFISIAALRNPDTAS